MLSRIALRLAAVQALKGRTLAGENVLDSHIGALDIDENANLATDQNRPFVAVYVERAKVEGAIELRDLRKSGTTEFIIEVGISEKMTAKNPETDEITVIGLGIPVTDDAMELYLDLLGRQVVDVLTDPENAWAEIWRSLSCGLARVERKRTADAGNGVRIAAHQLVVSLDLVADPVKGDPLRSGSAMARFLAACRASGNADLGAHADMIEAVLAGSSPDWLLDQRRQGMTRDEMCAMQLVPVEGAADTDITQVVVTGP